MSKEDTLRRLEELFNAKEVTDGFPSQAACVSWANRAAPLLRFNNQYYQTFMHYSQIINRNVSTYTAEPAFRTMVSQVEMAIEELKVDIANPKEPAQESDSSEIKTDVIDIKPNFFGLGINLNEAWHRAKGWFIKS